MDNKNNVLTLQDHNTYHVQYVFEVDDGIKASKLSGSSVVTNGGFKKNIVTGAMCTLMIFGGASAPSPLVQGSPVQSLSPQILTASQSNGKINHLRNDKRHFGGQEIVTYFYSGSSISKFVSNSYGVAYNGEEVQWKEEKEMYNKLLKHRDRVEKSGIYFGGILSAAILLSSLLTSSIPWSATVPAAVLCASLPTSFLIKRKRREMLYESRNN